MRRVFFAFFIIFINSVIYSQDYQPKTPSWSNDLIMLDVSPKNFTSPNGPGSGTFNSAKEKMAYYADLGVNSMWFAGHNWADDKHFYNIWTQYACFRPDSIEPTLGTFADFKEMVAEAHRNKIKIFMDVVSHGVMNNSPLIKEHPHWFKGGSWGMTDYDWAGNHPDLDTWWINTWMRYVKDANVDGFRIDCDIYRPDLWAIIKKKSNEIGKEIFIMEEGPVRFSQVTDCRQLALSLTSHDGIKENHPLLHDAGKFLNSFLKDYNHYFVNINYKNNKTINVKPSDNKIIKIDHSIIPYQSNGMKYDSYKATLKIIGIANMDSISYCQVTRFENTFDLYDLNFYIDYNSTNTHPNWPNATSNSDTLVVEIPEIPVDKEVITLQLSNTESGWEGFPLKVNPYTSQGSRCIVGYSSMFLPVLPIMMVGEEFNCSSNPHPKIKPSLFGDKGTEGDGMWLYGNVIDWKLAEKPDNKAFYKDFKKIVTIRKSESDLIHAIGPDSPVNIEPLVFSSNKNIPVPYILWNSKKVLIVGGNRNKTDVKCEINCPINKYLKGSKTFKVTELMSGKTIKCNSTQLKKFNFEIKKDYSEGGGIVIYKIEPLK